MSDLPTAEQLDQAEEILHVMDVTKGVIKLQKAFYEIKKQTLLVEMEIMNNNARLDEIENKERQKGLHIYDLIIEEYEKSSITFDFQSSLRIEALKIEFQKIVSNFQELPEYKKLVEYNQNLEKKFETLYDLANKKVKEIEEYQKKAIPTLPSIVMEASDEVEAALAKTREEAAKK